MDRELRDAFRRLLLSLDQEASESGRVGMVASGVYTVDVAGRNNYIHVRVMRFGAETVVQAFNMGVPRTYDYPVKLTKNPYTNELIASDPDLRSIEAWVSGSSGNVGTSPHTHRLGYGLEDYVEGLRLDPGLVIPHSGLSVLIQPFFFPYNGEDEYFAGEVLDLTAYVPATANSWRWVKVGIDPSTETGVAVSGTAYSTSASLTGDLLADISFSGYIPLAGIKVRNGATSLANIADWMDCRLWVSEASASSANSELLRVVVNNDEVVCNDDEVVYL